MQCLSVQNCVPCVPIWYIFTYMYVYIQVYIDILIFQPVNLWRDEPVEYMYIYVYIYVYVYICIDVYAKVLAKASVTAGAGI